ncbi:Aste57867_8344 [Aphanomyces stellatus]|uniref:Aste57867_8344 protein n=1 Tax=Aphanomyces stellatus TaxID=120398 RepID=A0A485KK25_9STRA|nr:hypothetical protein As57867_008312 [Aphanomyces stellatus]VFT85231.1 Aste57867_8344 [Aphanomyces stellatus]
MHPSLKALPSTLLIKLILYLSDGLTLFALLEALNSDDIRGPLEHLWQLGRTCQPTDLWPALCLGSAFSTMEDPANMTHVEVVLKYHPRVVVEGNVSLEWLQEHLPSTTTVEWRLGQNGDACITDQWKSMRVNKLHASKMAQLDSLWHILPSLTPHLTELVLANSNATSLAPLFDYLATSNVTKLCLVQVQENERPLSLSEHRMWQMINWIQSTPVRCLDLRHCEWRCFDVAEDWYAALLNCPTLETLRLVQCPRSGVHPKLQSPLALTEVDVDDFTLAQLAAQPGANVETLTLRRPFCDSFVSFFRKLLNALPESQVTTLTLSSTALIRRSTLMAYVAPLLVPTRLKALVLSWKVLSSQEAVHIAQAIQANRTIESLSVRGCRVTHDAIQALLECAKNRETPMKHISVEMTNEISPDDAESLYRAAATLGVHLKLDHQS